MTKKLIWNVYIQDFNKREIAVYNIFDNWNIIAAIKKAYKENPEDKEKFIEEVRKWLLYFFWAKYEWEVTIFNWTPDPDFRYKKIDVYQQIEMNWDAFTEYLWNNRELIKKLK